VRIHASTDAIENGIERIMKRARNQSYETRRVREASSNQRNEYLHYAEDLCRMTPLRSSSNALQPFPQTGAVYMGFQRCTHIDIDPSNDEVDLQHCTVMTDAGDCCDGHTKKKYGVYVAQSRIADVNGTSIGKETFAARSFNANEFIILFTGDILTSGRQSNQASNYALDIPHSNVIISAARSNSNVARFVNDGKSSKKHINNCYFGAKTMKDGRPGIALFANRKIKADVELLAAYGAEFWTQVAINDVAHAIASSTNAS
jgi:hypothetical protein